MAKRCGGGAAQISRGASAVVRISRGAQATFDEQLVGKLGYRGHLQCAALLGRTLGAPSGEPLQVVDLGAGTGLCGAPVRDALSAEAKLVAVDLSARMLDRCRERGDHDACVVGDAVGFLRTLEPASVDAVVAADVLAYAKRRARISSARISRDAAIRLHTDQWRRWAPATASLRRALGC